MRQKNGPEVNFVTDNLADNQSSTYCSSKRSLTLNSTGVINNTMFVGGGGVGVSARGKIKKRRYMKKIKRNKGFCGIISLKKMDFKGGRLCH